MAPPSRSSMAPASSPPSPGPHGSHPRRRPRANGGSWRVWLLVGVCFGLGYGLTQRLANLGPVEVFGGGGQRFGVKPFPGTGLDDLRERAGGRGEDIRADLDRIEAKRREQREREEVEKRRAELEERERSEQERERLREEQARREALEREVPAEPEPQADLAPQPLPGEPADEPPLPAPREEFPAPPPVPAPPSP